MVAVADRPRGPPARRLAGPARATSSSASASSPSPTPRSPGSASTSGHADELTDAGWPIGFALIAVAAHRDRAPAGSSPTDARRSGRRARSRRWVPQMPVALAGAVLAGRGICRRGHRAVPRPRRRRPARPRRRPPGARAARERRAGRGARGHGRRAPGPRGRARVPRPARPAHRPRQPGSVPRPPRAGAHGRRARRVSPCCSSTSTTSRP